MDPAKRSNRTQAQPAKQIVKPEENRIEEIVDSAECRFSHELEALPEEFSEIRLRPGYVVHEDSYELAELEIRERLAERNDRRIKELRQKHKKHQKREYPQKYLTENKSFLTLCQSYRHLKPMLEDAWRMRYNPYRTIERGDKVYLLFQGGSTLEQ